MPTAPDETLLADMILRETTTLGLRIQPIHRYEAQRELKEIQTSFGKIAIKSKIINGEVIQSVPEYEVCVQLARENDVNLAEIYQAAQKALEE